MKFVAMITELDFVIFGEIITKFELAFFCENYYRI